MEVPLLAPMENHPRIFSTRIDTLGQSAGLNIYTQISLIYPVTDTTSHPSIVKTLMQGLERVSSNFPWMAGQVLPEESTERQAVYFSIQPFDKVPQFVVRDLQNDRLAPTMGGLRAAQFPFRMLDENLIAPRMTFPKLDKEGTSVPVFAAQVNFIKGGLILTFAGQHQAMDGTGIGQCMDLLSKACHPDKEFTSEELALGNMDRKNLIPLIEDESYKSDAQLARQIPPEAQTDGTNAPPAPPKCVWKYFSFSPRSLASLKALATKSLPKGAGYASTDDTLSAFIWRSIVRARLPRFSESREATFGRAVDVRRYLNIPATYPGTVNNMCYLTLPISTLVDKQTSLGSIASQLRALVDPKTSSLGQHTRALITYHERSGNRAEANPAATLKLDLDIMLSSWAKIDAFELDFNMGLGKPEAVRRPMFEPVESLLYLMPRRGDGEISVAVALREEDMERLKDDDEFRKYAVYID